MNLKRLFAIFLLLCSWISRDVLADAPNDAAIFQVVVGAGGYVSSPTATGLVHGKIVFDSANNAYFCDLTGSKLYRVTSAGVASAIPNLACTDVAIDAQSNTLYIADYIGGAISKVGLNGNAWPLTPIPIISGLGMYNPVGVSIDPANPSRYLYYAAQG